MANRWLDTYGSSGAHHSYVRSLTEQFREGRIVYDPSFTLRQDPESYWKVRLDPVIQQESTYRKNLVAGRNWIMSPGSDGEELDVQAAGAMQTLFGEIGNLHQALRNLAEAIFRGNAWAYPEIELRQLKVAGVKRQWAVPTWITDMNQLRLVGESYVNPISRRKAIRTLCWDVEKEAFVPLENQEYFIKHVYDDVEESLGFGRGLFDALWYPWWAKQVLWREMLGGAERAGRGFLLAKIDGQIQGSSGKTNTTMREKFMTEMERHLSRGVLAFDKRHEVELVTGFGEGHQMIMGGIKYCDESLRGLIIGAQLPTGGGTEGGSYALGKVQENATESLVQFDRLVLAAAVTSSLVKLVWDMNRAPLAEMGLADANMPKFEIVNEKYEDPEKESKITEAALNAGLDLDMEETYTKMGRTVPKPGRAVIKGKVAMAPMPGMGGDPFGGGQPGAPGAGAPPGQGSGNPFVDMLREGAKRNGMAPDQVESMMAAYFTAFPNQKAGASVADHGRSAGIPFTSGRSREAHREELLGFVSAYMEKVESEADVNALRAVVSEVVKKELDDMKIDVNVTMPEQKAPVFNIPAQPAPIVQVAAPVVHVAPAQVTVAPAQVDVHVAAPKPTQKTVTFVRDAKTGDLASADITSK